MQNTDVVYFPIRDLFIQHQQTYRDLSGQHVYYIAFLYTYACSFSFIQGKWLLSISTRAQVCDKNTFVAFHNFQRRHMLALRSDFPFLSISEFSHRDEDEGSSPDSALGTCPSSNSEPTPRENIKPTYFTFEFQGESRNLSPR